MQRDSQIVAAVTVKKTQQQLAESVTIHVGIYENAATKSTQIYPRIYAIETRKFMQIHTNT
jgi:hypothetical protein